ncbi:hypothetical protein M7I_4065 [Glarea lozoyensis 74030]|uniref:Uncharacterized protein n=1 Tax=Glarea lozoyensis (strain ATCC 74030 / MF5533) TaxID=1104152 RepID=H0EN62_GLAL7|nr:hypothetical protein M7I_4065 [Glarea lozoyensis 74030]
MSMMIPIREVYLLDRGSCTLPDPPNQYHPHDQVVES